MSTHFTLDFSIARLATETLGLYPRLEFRTHNTANLLGNLSAVLSNNKIWFPQHSKVEHYTHTYIYIFFFFYQQRVPFVRAQVLCSCSRLEVALLAQSWHGLKSRAVTLLILSWSLWCDSLVQMIWDQIPVCTHLCSLKVTAVLPPFLYPDLFIFILTRFHYVTSL